MNYYLAFLREYGSSNGYYELVKANTFQEARQKVRDKYGTNMIVDVSDTIE